MSGPVKEVINEVNKSQNKISDMKKFWENFSNNKKTTNQMNSNYVSKPVQSSSSIKTTVNNLYNLNIKDNNLNNYKPLNKLNIAANYGLISPIKRGAENFNFSTLKPIKISDNEIKLKETKINEDLKENESIIRIFDNNKKSSQSNLTSNKSINNNQKKETANLTINNDHYIDKLKPSIIRTPKNTEKQNNNCLKNISSSSSASSFTFKNKGAIASLADPPTQRLQVIKAHNMSENEKKMSYLNFTNKILENYNIQVKNFTSSWANGIAFCGIVYYFYPDEENLNPNKLNPKNIRYNLELAFKVAKERANIEPIMDVNDIIKFNNCLDYKCMLLTISYLIQGLVASKIKK